MISSNYFVRVELQRRALLCSLQRVPVVLCSNQHVVVTSNRQFIPVLSIMSTAEGLYRRALSSMLHVWSRRRPSIERLEPFCEEVGTRNDNIGGNVLFVACRRNPKRWEQMETRMPPISELAD